MDADHRTHPKESLSRLAKTPQQSLWGQPLPPSGLFLVPVSRAVRLLGAKSQPSQPAHPPPPLATHSWVSVHASLPWLSVEAGTSSLGRPGTPPPLPLPFSPPSTQWPPGPASGSGPAEHGAGGGLGAQHGHAAFRRHLSSPLTHHEITVSLLVGAAPVAAEPSVPVGSGPPGGQKGPRPRGQPLPATVQGSCGGP